jgi:hypothetical protein
MPSKLVEDSNDGSCSLTSSSRLRPIRMAMPDATSGRKAPSDPEPPTCTDRHHQSTENGQYSVLVEAARVQPQQTPVASFLSSPAPVHPLTDPKSLPASVADTPSTDSAVARPIVNMPALKTIVLLSLHPPTAPRPRSRQHRSGGGPGQVDAVGSPGRRSPFWL